MSLSSGGALDIYNASGTVNAIVDVDGYLSSTTSGYFEPLARPGSVTRGATGHDSLRRAYPLGGGTLNVQMSGNGGVPSEAAAVVANVTATGATAPSFSRLPGYAASRPLASDLNFVSGGPCPISASQGVLDRCTRHLQCLRLGERAGRRGGMVHVVDERPLPSI